MITIIKPRRRIEIEEFALDYRWNKDRYSGFSFPCDREGNPHPLKSAAARANYEKCLSFKEDIVFLGVVDLSRCYMEPAEGRCRCGQTVLLEDSFENACACGRLYGIDGGELHQNWRRELYEETGELI